MAAGQFQAFRYLGSILATTLLGILFGGAIQSSGLLVLAGVLAGTSILLLVIAVRMNAPSKRSPL